MNNDQNFFTWQNFRELANLDDHISYVTSLIEKYKWDDKVQRELKGQLQRILDKQNDKQLNLSVIGEFTTGKSSFINALVREDLLSASIMQGTTQANTVIEQGEGYKIEVTYLNDVRMEQEFPSYTELREFLKSVTTDPEICPQVRQVRVSLPSKNLAKGIRIIDTPGTNALEVWHEEVTQRALRELSDLSVILVDATKPVPESLCQFVENNLSDIVQQCVFVVTKLDLVPQRERSQMMEYIRKKLRHVTGETDVVVLPYVSIFVYNPQNEFTVDPELLDLSLRSEEQLFTHTANQRLKAQAKKLVSLTGQLYEQLTLQMDEIQTGYEKELELLQKSKQTDLSEFIGKETQQRQKNFQNAIVDDCEKFYAKQEEVGKNLLEVIDRRLKEKDSVKAIKEYIDYFLSIDCKDNSTKIINHTEVAYKQIRRLFIREMETFQEHFEQLFTQLSILRIDFKNTAYHYPDDIKVDTANLTNVTSYISEAASQESKYKWGGSFGGMVLGNIIAPGVGAVIGWFIGKSWGKKKGPALDEVRAQALDKLNQPIRSYTKHTIDVCVEAYDQYATAMTKNLDTEIQRYLQTYKDEVDKRIAEQKKKEDSIKQKIQLIEAEQHTIDNRQMALASIQQKL